MTYLLISTIAICAITIAVLTVRERKRQRNAAWDSHMTDVAERLRQSILNPPAPKPDPMEDEELLAAARKQGFPLAVDSDVVGKMRIDPSPPFGDDVSYGYESDDRVTVEPLGAFKLDASVGIDELNSDFVARIERQVSWLRSNIEDVLSDSAPIVLRLIKSYDFHKEAPHVLDIPKLWSQLDANVLVLWPTEYRLILEDPGSDLHGLDLCIEFDSDARITSVYFDG